jgi:hypothetical protein
MSPTCCWARFEPPRAAAFGFDSRNADPGWERFEAFLWSTSSLLMVAEGGSLVVDPAISVDEVAGIGRRALELAAPVRHVLITLCVPETRFSPECRVEQRKRPRPAVPLLPRAERARQEQSVLLCSSKPSRNGASLPEGFLLLRGGRKRGTRMNQEVP